MYSIDQIYAAIKNEDTRIRKNFNDESINDLDYYKYSIYADLLNNAFSILFNLRLDNELSIGIDTNCRGIIEFFVLNEMLNNNEISKEQLSIFRSSFIVVDYHNNEKDIEKYQGKFKDEYIQKYNKVINEMTKFYKCTKEELIAAHPGDPNFYLKKKLDDNITFESLLRKHNLLDGIGLTLYRFFGMNVHPLFINDEEIEKDYLDKRHEFIFLLLDEVVNYIETQNINLDIDVDKVDKDIFFEKNEALVGNYQNAILLDGIFTRLEKETCYFKNGTDNFEINHLRKVKFIVKDMMTLASLGHTDQTIAKFKSFVELISVHSLIKYSKNVNEYDSLRIGFMISSLIEIFLPFSKQSEIYKLVKMPLESVYSSYYKNIYGVVGPEKLYNLFKTNSLAFIIKGKKNYKNLVRRGLRQICTSNEEYLHASNLYLISSDFNHSSGYSFNSNNSAEILPAFAMLEFVFFYLKNYVKDIQANFKDKNFSFELSNFEILRLMYNKQVEELSVKFANVIDLDAFHV